MSEKNSTCITNKPKGAVGGVTIKNATSVNNDFAISNLINDGADTCNQQLNQQRTPIPQNSQQTKSSVTHSPQGIRPLFQPYPPGFFAA
jgi:hypothetical protein